MLPAERMRVRDVLLTRSLRRALACEGRVVAVRAEKTLSLANLTTVSLVPGVPPTLPWHEQILRMWKGVRDAECGWLEIVESWEGRRVAAVGQKPRLAAAAMAPPPGEAAATPVVGLYLAILAPLRGRVELWRMRHGPCVRVVPAPAGARLLTSRPSAVESPEGGHSDGPDKGRHAEALTSCYLLSGGARGAGGSEATKLLLSPLVVEEDDLADLPNR